MNKICNYEKANNNRVFALNVYSQTNNNTLSNFVNECACKIIWQIKKTFVYLIMKIEKRIFWIITLLAMAFVFYAGYKFYQFIYWLF